MKGKKKMDVDMKMGTWMKIQENVKRFQKNTFHNRAAS